MHRSRPSAVNLNPDGWLPPANTLVSSMLESLPYRLLEIIFRLACTDGGRTGCSLSLVSKSIHTTSRASRFHSVSILSGTSVQLRHFMDALDIAKADARADDVSLPCVRHLCIYLTPAFEFPNVKLTDQDVAIAHERSRLTRELSVEDLIASRIGMWEEYHRTFRSLCAIIRPDVETMCLLRHNRSMMFHPREYQLPPIPEIRCPGGFPRLRELAFTDELPPFVPGVNTGTSAAALYPALRRLHMSISNYSKMDFEWLAANAPHITWLRINTGKTFIYDGIRFLPRFARVVDKSLANGSQAPSFSELKTLMFMVHPTFRSDKPSPESVAAYDKFASALGATLAAFGVPTTVLQPHYDNQDVIGSWGLRQSKHMDEGMRQDWLLGIEGREGTFTPEFWTRTPGVLEALWKTVCRIYGF